MPDGPDIDIAFKTTADTAGAQEAKKSIFGVQDAAKAAQQQADVETAKGRQAAAVQREQAAALREIADGQQRIIAANLAQAISRITGEFSHLNEETRMAMDQTQSFLTIFATTGNPIAAAFAMAASGVTSYVAALRDAEEQSKKIEKEQIANIKRVAEARRDLAFQISQEKIVDFFQRELTEIEKQEKATERLLKLRQSERELAASNAANQNAAAVTTGATPEAAAASNLGFTVANQIAALQDSIVRDQAALKKAEDDALMLEFSVKSLAENTPEWIKASEAAKKARATSDALALDVATSIEITTNKISQVLNAGETSINNISQEGQTAFAAAVSKVIEEIRASAARTGQQLTATEQANVTEFQKLITDRIDDSKQMGRFKVLIDNLHASRVASDAAVNSALEKLSGGWDAQMKIINPLIGEISRLKQEQINMQNRINGLQLRN